MKTLSVRTTTEIEFQHLTSKIQTIVTESGVRTGTCFIFVPHTTVAITMNENADPAVLTDLTREFKRLTPQRADFEHDEGNSPAHLSSSLTGQSLFVFVENGSLVLGRWQAIYLVEFDGPRRRDILINIVADS